MHTNNVAMMFKVMYINVCLIHQLYKYKSSIKSYDFYTKQFIFRDEKGKIK